MTRTQNDKTAPKPKPEYEFWGPTKKDLERLAVRMKAAWRAFRIEPDLTRAAVKERTGPEFLYVAAGEAISHSRASLERESDKALKFAGAVRAQVDWVKDRSQQLNDVRPEIARTPERQPERTAPARQPREMKTKTERQLEESIAQIKARKQQERRPVMEPTR
jgi:hypothetical protein